MGTTTSTIGATSRTTSAHFHPAAPERFNFDAAVYFIKQAPLINWMQTFPMEDVKNEHVGGYCISKVLMQNSPVLHLQHHHIPNHQDDAEGNFDFHNFATHEHPVPCHNDSDVDDFSRQFAAVLPSALGSRSSPRSGSPEQGAFLWERDVLLRHRGGGGDDLGLFAASGSELVVDAIEDIDSEEEVMKMIPALVSHFRGLGFVFDD